MISLEVNNIEYLVAVTKLMMILQTRPTASFSSYWFQMISPFSLRRFNSDKLGYGLVNDLASLKPSSILSEEGPCRECSGSLSYCMMIFFTVF